MERSEKPAIGTTEAAVRSCVSLMAAVFGQSEELIAYWLDLYYQVRSAYEREARKDQPEPLRSGVVYTLIREILHEELAAVAVVPLAGIRAEESEDRTEDAGDGPQIAAPAIIDPMELAKAAEKAMGRRNRAMGSQDTKDLTAEEIMGPKIGVRGWAAKKNAIRDRLTQARKDGISVPQIVEASGGTVTDDEVFGVINASKMPFETYRRIGAALETLGK